MVAAAAQLTTRTEPAGGGSGGTAPSGLNDVVTRISTSIGTQFSIVSVKRHWRTASSATVWKSGCVASTVCNSLIAPSVPMIACMTTRPSTFEPVIEVG